MYCSCCACAMTVSKLIYAWCQLTHWDVPDCDGLGWGVGLLWLTSFLCLQVHYSCRLGVGRRELRRCLCICVREFNMEQSAQFRDGERVDSSTGTAERPDAIKRSRSRCWRAESIAAHRAAKCERERHRRSSEKLNRPWLDEQQIIVGRIDVGPLKRLNRQMPNGLQTVVGQGGVEVVCVTLGNYHVEARLWLIRL